MVVNMVKRSLQVRSWRTRRTSRLKNPPNQRTTMMGKASTEGLNTEANRKHPCNQSANWRFQSLNNENNQSASDNYWLQESTWIFLKDYPFVLYATTQLTDT